jgi:hypothetical protein
MNWKEMLRKEIESTYKVTDGLMELVDKNQLEWKPASGSNWMTVSQLLRHLTDACGAPIKGFVTGDWGMPEGFDVANIPPEEMLPSAEKLPAIDSVAAAKTLLAKDKLVALEMLEKCDENRLASEIATAPWDKTEMVLGYRILQMIEHLGKHSSQLFYYLKLQGKPVNTSHLWP